MKRILVTGGTSMLGRPLILCLTAQGDIPVVTTRGPVREPVHGVEYRRGDIADPGFAASVVGGVDEVFHLASHRRNAPYHKVHRQEMIDVNTAIARSLITAVSGRSLPVTVFSSALVGTLPEGADAAGVEDGYLASKILCERLWNAAARERGFPLLIVRPVGAYGPWDNFTPDANVVPSLIMRCMREPELTVWGSGAQKRAFLYAPDAADAVLRLRDEGVAGTHFLSPQSAVTIAELAGMIRDLVRPGAPIRFDTSKPDGPDLPAYAVPEELRTFPWTPLAEGLRRTVEWYRMNGNSLLKGI